MAQKQVLGKGLASLLPGAGVSAGAPLESDGAVAAGPATTVQQQEMGSRDRHMGISMCNVEDIIPNPYQPRRDFDEQALEELVQSIRSNGIIQPLVVRKNAQGEYQLIAGERRLRAAKKAELKQVPVVIRKSTDREALEIALIENIQRQDLNCIDEALAYLQLIQDFSLTQEEIAERVGKDRATVANSLRLLRLPEAIIEDLKRQILSFGHGKALLSLEDNEAKLKLRARIIEEKLSVRATEALVEAFKESRITDKNATGVDSLINTPLKNRFLTLGQELTRLWSAKVIFKGGEVRGKIVIQYSSREELDRLVDTMQCKDLWLTQKTSPSR